MDFFVIKCTDVATIGSTELIIRFAHLTMKTAHHETRRSRTKYLECFRKSRVLIISYLK